jgi:hypothetical protein
LPFRPTRFPLNPRAAASDRLCFQSGRGCWVAGQQGSYCAFIDPDGSGGSYARYCSEKHFAVCYAKLP